MIAGAGGGLGGGGCDYSFPDGFMCPQYGHLPSRNVPPQYKQFSIFCVPYD